jgi:hypothetical protein
MTFKQTTKESGEIRPAHKEASSISGTENNAKVQGRKVWWNVGITTQSKWNRKRSKIAGARTKRSL